MSLGAARFVIGTLVRTFEAALNAVYVIAAVLSFWRSRLWHLALYSAVTALVIARWLHTEHESAVGDTLLILQILAPFALAALTYAALCAAARWPGRKRAVLTGGIVVLVGLWMAAKYPALRAHIPVLGARLTVPILGLSYCVVKLVHVLADAMRPKSPRIKPLTLAAFTLFPTTYASGPMHRYEEFSASFDDLPRARDRDWATVIRRVTWGTLQASVLAAHLGDWVLRILASPGGWSAGALWLAMYGYAGYIYLSFAGMSDLAIGIGAALGVRVPENFQRPYLQLDIQSFWRNWHMTFTRWLQAYVFMPLSKRLVRGALRKQPKVAAGLGYVVTFLLCGAWHGEGANFLLWGLWHGLGLWAYTSLPPKWRAPVGGGRVGWRGLAWWLATFHFVCFGWILFACPLDGALAVVRGMFGLG